MPLAGPCASAVGELAKTHFETDFQSHTAHSKKKNPFHIFPYFLQAFSPSTLGPNELCSLVAIRSQMCCQSCQCDGMVCDTNTHSLTHGGHCQLIKTATLLCDAPSCSQLSYSFTLLLSSCVPTSPSSQSAFLTQHGCALCSARAP